jgi:hypothetical protein
MRCKSVNRQMNQCVNSPHSRLVLVVVFEPTRDRGSMLFFLNTAIPDALSHRATL